MKTRLQPKRLVIRLRITKRQRFVGILLAPFILGAGIYGLMTTIPSLGKWLLRSTTAAQNNSFLITLFDLISAILILGILAAVCLYVYIDYKAHKKPLRIEDPYVPYTLKHHTKAVILPLVRYKKKQISFVLVYPIVTILVLSLSVGMSLERVSAAVPNNYELESVLYGNGTGTPPQQPFRFSPPLEIERYNGETYMDTFDPFTGVSGKFSTKITKYNDNTAMTPAEEIVDVGKAISKQVAIAREFSINSNGEFIVAPIVSEDETENNTIYTINNQNQVVRSFTLTGCIDTVGNFDSGPDSNDIYIGLVRIATAATNNIYIHRNTFDDQHTIPQCAQVYSSTGTPVYSISATQLSQHFRSVASYTNQNTGDEYMILVVDDEDDNNAESTIYRCLVVNGAAQDLNDCTAIHSRPDDPSDDGYSSIQDIEVVNSSVYVLGISNSEPYNNILVIDAMTGAETLTFDGSNGSTELNRWSGAERIGVDGSGVSVAIHFRESVYSSLRLYTPTGTFVKHLGYEPSTDQDNFFNNLFTTERMTQFFGGLGVSLNTKKNAVQYTTFPIPGHEGSYQNNMYDYVLGGDSGTTSWDRDPINSGAISMPIDQDTDVVGNTYIAYYGTGVVKYDPSNQYISTCTLDEYDSFKVDISIDNANNTIMTVLTGDTDSGPVLRRYSYDGSSCSFIEEIDAFSGSNYTDITLGLSDITSFSPNIILVSDASRRTVHKCTKDNNDWTCSDIVERCAPDVEDSVIDAPTLQIRLEVVSECLNQPGGLWLPYAITSDEQGFYVSDYSGRIQRFTIDGEYIDQFTVPSTSEVNNPYAIGLFSMDVATSIDYKDCRLVAQNIFRNEVYIIKTSDECYDLAVSQKLLSASPVKAGDEVEIEITITNTGTAPLNPEITLPTILPKEFDFLSVRLANNSSEPDTVYGPTNVEDLDFDEEYFQSQYSGHAILTFAYNPPAIGVIQPGQYIKLVLKGTAKSGFIDGSTRNRVALLSNDDNDFTEEIIAQQIDANQDIYTYQTNNVSVWTYSLATPTTPTNPTSPTKPPTSTTPKPKLPRRPASPVAPPTITDSNPGGPLSPLDIFRPVTKEALPKKQSAKKLPFVYQTVPFLFLSLLLLVALSFALKSWQEYRRTRAIVVLLDRYETTIAGIRSYLQLIAHYLNTPVAIMQNALELLQSKKTLPESVATTVYGQLKQLGTFAATVQSDTQAAIAGEAQVAGAVISPVNTVEQVAKQVDHAKLIEVLKEKTVWGTLVGIAVAITATDIAVLVIGNYRLAELRYMNHVALFALGAVLLVTFKWLHGRSKAYTHAKQVLLDKQRTLQSQQQRMLGETAEALKGHHQTLTNSSNEFKHLPTTRLYFNGLAMLGKLTDSLTFARSVTAMQQDLPIQNVSTMVTTALTPLQDQIASKKLKLTTTIPATLAVAAEQQHAQYLVQALAENAVHFAPEGSSITISAKQTGKHVVLSVTDQGPGLPKDKLQTLFQPFARGTSTETFDQQGLGMGLYNTKLLAEQLGGTLTLNNTKPHGLTATVQLPKPAKASGIQSTVISPQKA